MFTSGVIADPIDDDGRRRDDEGVRWDEKHELWMVRRHGRPAVDQSETRA